MKRLTYIESTGTQYIDTEFKHNQNTRFLADIDYTPNQAWEPLFGSCGGPNINPQKIFGPQYQGTRMNVHYGRLNQFQYFTSGYSGRHIWDFNKNIFKIDNLTKTFANDTFQSIYNDLIFTWSSYDGLPPAKNPSMKLYSFKIYDNGEIVRDFIPALDDNEVACLFDRVTGQYFYNQGTGDFIAGEPLIYDRTQADVDYALNNPDSASFLKGAYNYTDLNRVEQWCDIVADELNTYNYSVQLTTPKTDWIMEDFPIEVELERIRQNVQRLKDAFVTFTMVPANMEKVTYQKANDLERVLHELDVLINNMIQSFIFSNEIYSGEVQK